MTQTTFQVSLTQIDENPDNWVQSLLSMNNYPSTGQSDDKLIAYDLTKDYLVPTSMKEVLNLSDDFLRLLAENFGYSHNSRRNNALAVLWEMYEMEKISEPDLSYMSSPDFNDTFLNTDNEQTHLHTGSTILRALNSPTQVARAVKEELCKKCDQQQIYGFCTKCDNIPVEIADQIEFEYYVDNNPDSLVDYLSTN